MPAVVISMEEGHADNAILLDYLISQGALEDCGIGNTDPNIPIDSNCTVDSLHFRMPGGSRDYIDECDESNEHDAIPSTSRPRWATTELTRLWDQAEIIAGHKKVVDKWNSEDLLLADDPSNQ